MLIFRQEALATLENLRTETVGNLEDEAVNLGKRVEVLQAAKAPPKKKGRKGPSTSNETRMAEISALQKEIEGVRYHFTIFCFA
jgi:hypothetical protein